MTMPHVEVPGEEVPEVVAEVSGLELLQEVWWDTCLETEEVEGKSKLYIPSTINSQNIFNFAHGM